MGRFWAVLALACVTACADTHSSDEELESAKGGKGKIADVDPEQPYDPEPGEDAGEGVQTDAGDAGALPLVVDAGGGETPKGDAGSSSPTADAGGTVTKDAGSSSPADAGMPRTFFDGRTIAGFAVGQTHHFIFRIDANGYSGKLEHYNAETGIQYQTLGVWILEPDLWTAQSGPERFDFRFDTAQRKVLTLVYETPFTFSDGRTVRYADSTSNVRFVDETR